METFEKQVSPEQFRQDKVFFRKILDIMAGQARVKRWREEGESAFLTPEEVTSRPEVVAEHGFGMTTIIVMVFKKARQEGDTSITNLNFENVVSKTVFHDLEETETGDVRVKTDAHREKEGVAVDNLRAQAESLSIGPDIVKDIDEYNNKETPEDRFVKAVDELQAWLYMVYSRSIHQSNRNFNEPDDLPGYKYAKEFPTLHRLMKTALGVMKHPRILGDEIPEMVEPV